MNGFNLNKEFLIKEYNYFKEKAIYFNKKGRLHDCITYIKYCGNIAWHYPILTNYVDELLESTMVDIKTKLNCSKDYAEIKNKKKIVFYNSQIVDSGALTEQYLHYFIENDYKVLLIIPDKKNSLLGNHILELISNEQNIELYIASSKSDLKKIKEIDSIVRNYGATLAFLHFIPNDVVGYTVFSDLTFIKRYYIVHNDHTFWFGKGCSDYFIEFRKFGYRLAIERRGINWNKIHNIPYYPIIQKTNFQGFPFDSKGKIVGFSAANLYKYYLDPELKFFYAIKELLNRNDNFIFCLAGYGNTTIIQQFITNNNLQNRFYFLGKRSDFSALVNQVDILFESYPLKGGLTVLYGIENKKAIVGIGNNRNASGTLEDFFDLDSYRQPLNINDFINEADKLIKDKAYRTQNVQMFLSSKYTKSSFNNSLSIILNGEEHLKHEIYTEKLNLDDGYYLNEFLSLPEIDFDYFYNKMFILKASLSLAQRISIFYYCSKKNPYKMRGRLLRHILLLLGI